MSNEFDPQGYHESNDGQFKHALRELRRIQFSKTDNVLDVGSGDGRITEHIARECGPIVGIDNNADMVNFAESNCKESNVRYIHADIVTYSPDTFGGYDKIVSFWALHWVFEYDRAFGNIANLLKPGGQALLCHMVGRDPFLEIIEDLLDTDAWEPFKKNFKWLPTPSLSTVAQEIEASGLRIESLEVQVKSGGEWILLEKEKQNFLSLGLFDFIPLAQGRKEFCDQVFDLFIRDWPLNENGEMFVWMPIVVMLLRK